MDTLRPLREILAAVRISEVWAALGGGPLRRGRGQAFWRGGDGFNVDLDDAKGVWYDLPRERGGGVLDLVQRVRGGSRADALKYCAELAGVPLERREWTGTERQAWAEQRRRDEAELPAAKHWRRATLALSDEVLQRLKLGINDRDYPVPHPGEIQALENLYRTLRRGSDGILLTEFREWRRREPALTEALVYAGARVDGAVQRAAWRIIDELVPEAA